VKSTHRQRSRCVWNGKKTIIWTRKSCKILVGKRFYWVINKRVKCESPI